MLDLLIDSHQSEANKVTIHVEMVCLEHMLRHFQLEIVIVGVFNLVSVRRWRYRLRRRIFIVISVRDTQFRGHNRVLARLLMNEKVCEDIHIDRVRERPIRFFLCRESHYLLHFLRELNI